MRLSRPDEAELERVRHLSLNATAAKEGRHFAQRSRLPALRCAKGLGEPESTDQWLASAARPGLQLLTLVGGALLGQKKYAEAEPLLLQGYESDEAKKWRAERAKYPPGKSKTPEKQ